MQVSRSVTWCFRWNYPIFKCMLTQEVKMILFQKLPKILVNLIYSNIKIEQWATREWFQGRAISQKWACHQIKIIWSTRWTSGTTKTARQRRRNARKCRADRSASTRWTFKIVVIWHIHLTYKSYILFIETYWVASHSIVVSEAIALPTMAEGNSLGIHGCNIFITL